MIFLLLSDFFFKNFLHLKRSLFGQIFPWAIFWGRNFQNVKARRKFVNKNAIKREKNVGMGDIFWLGHNLAYFEAVWGIFSV